MVTRGPSVVTRGPSVVHPWSIRGPSVVTRGHPWSLVAHSCVLLEQINIFVYRNLNLFEFLFVSVLCFHPFVVRFAYKEFSLNAVGLQRSTSSVQYIKESEHV